MATASTDLNDSVFLSAVIVFLKVDFEGQGALATSTFLWVIPLNQNYLHGWTTHLNQTDLNWNEGENTSDFCIFESTRHTMVIMTSKLNVYYSAKMLHLQRFYYSSSNKF